MQSIESSRIDLPTVLKHFRKHHGPNATGWFMLDYERGFIPVLGRDHQSVEFKALVQHLAEVLERLHVEFPNARWTFYDIPNITYYVNDSSKKTGKVDWPSAPEEVRQREFSRLEAMRPVLDRMDWFAPCLYDWRSNKILIDRGSPESIDAEARWRTSLVKWTRDYISRSARPRRPLLPMVHTRWVNRGSKSGGPSGAFIPVEEFLLDQVRPSIEGGAEGLTFWSADIQAITRAFSPRGVDLERLKKTRNSLAEGSGLKRLNWTSQIDRQRLTNAIGNKEIERFRKARKAFLNPASAAEENSPQGEP
jgi:hypothetical protein